MIEKAHPQQMVSDGIAAEENDPPSSSRIPLSMTQKTAARRMLQIARESVKKNESEDGLEPSGRIPAGIEGEI